MPSATCPHAQSSSPSLPSPIEGSRQSSSIPKSPNSFWQYPSTQQFQNSLQRKGFHTEEQDIPMLVSIHNFLNEGVWKEICKWEQLNGPSQQETPNSESRLILKRFEGRPTEPTWKARILSKLRISEAPFDRHDWWVERVNGTSRQEVKYVIDYYTGREAGEDFATFHVDVRPAIDSFSALKHRIVAFLRRRVEGERA